MNRNDYENTEVNMFLSQAIAHHSNIENLAERAYFITLHLIQGTDAKRLFKPMFIKANKTLYENASATGERRSSLIVAADVEGTRSSKGEFSNPICSHIHGIWILSPEDHAKWKPYERVLQSRLVRNLYKLREVAGRDLAATVKPVYGGLMGLKKAVGYATKAHRQANRRGYWFPSPEVYPYEIEIDKAVGTSAEDLSARAEKVFNTLSKDDGGSSFSFSPRREWMNVG